MKKLATKSKSRSRRISFAFATVLAGIPVALLPGPIILRGSASESIPLLRSAAPSVADGEAPAPYRRHRVLYLTHSAGFKHAALPLSEQIFKEIGQPAGFDVTPTDDCSLISKAGLKDYDAVAFYTTGELPISDSQKADLLEFVKSGKGFVGIHSATDTFYKWADYGEMIGAYFDGHPWHQQVKIKVEDLRHPATRHLGSAFTITDEIYQFRNWSREGVHVLLSLDVGSVDLSKPGVHRTDGDFANSWCREYGKGRVFYTALGHRPEVWQDERFQKHLIGGLKWTVREE
jgi:type 1 glutamine amidotransferase